MVSLLQIAKCRVTDLRVVYVDARSVFAQGGRQLEVNADYRPALTSPTIRI